MTAEATFEGDLGGRRRTGVLLLNVGTPQSPDPEDVRRYLREFLSDPRVLDIAPIARWLLLNLVILRKRPAESGEAYAKIWTDKGSPLLTHSLGLAELVEKELSFQSKVAVAMRYGEPSIEASMRSLQEWGATQLIVFPQYPHYASSSTGSSLEKVYELAGKWWNIPSLSVVPPFYDHPGYLAAFVEVAKPVLAELSPERVLFSFHGLPERHIRKSDPSGAWCLTRESCCERICFENRWCYRAQCFETARLIAVGIECGDRWAVAFQSRLGRDPWIKPYTDEMIISWAKEGVKRVAVFCPAFVADCLETLEEIGMRGDEDFRAHGGERLELVPSLNTHPRWVETAVSMIESGRQAHI